MDPEILQEDERKRDILKTRMVRSTVTGHRGFVYSADLVVVASKQAQRFEQIVYQGNCHTLVSVRTDAHFTYMQPSPPLPIQPFVHHIPLQIKNMDPANMCFEEYDSHGFFIRPGAVWVCCHSFEEAEAALSMPVYTKCKSFAGLVYDSAEEVVYNCSCYNELYAMPCFKE